MRAFVIWLALAGVASAQGDGEIKSFPKVDPYTNGDPGALQKAGYASYGPFRFGDDHTTDQIVTTMGGIPLLWVETEHFKLGSGLPEYTLKDDPKEKERIKGELERLQTRLPEVKVKTKKLDPWLRLHLFAQRLEELYASFMSAFGLQESEFPTAPPDPKKKSAGPYMGEGRYLGASSKFTVLLFDKRSHVGRYSLSYLGKSLGAPTRWHFEAVDSWLFLTAAEFLEGDYINDSAFTCDVASSVSHNLGSAFRGYHVTLPFAISEGLAHWFSRKIDPRFHFFSGLDLTKVRIRDEWNWAPSVRARVEHKVFPSTSDMLGWNDPEALEWAQHQILWSRMDYLIAREDGAAGKILRMLKEPPKRLLSAEEIAERARDAILTSTGGDLDKFDADWSDWVLRTYPKK
jgi:hypothetical protein